MQRINNSIRAKEVRLIGLDGTQVGISGKCDGARLCEILQCKTFQMVPCTTGSLAGSCEIWCNELGMYENTLNASATNLLGNQVYGGQLYGNVLVVRCGFVE